MSKSIKILHVITNLSTGGAEIMLLKLIERLDLRFTSHVISLRSMSDIGPQLQALGITVDTLEMKPARLNIISLFRLIRKIKATSPDLVHTWMYHADFIGGLAARMVGIKTVWSIRHSDLSTAANKRSTLIVVRLCAWLSGWLPRKVLVNSNVARIVHESVGYEAKKMVVIPNGFDLALFIPSSMVRDVVRHELGLNQTVPLVGVIGRYHPQKNQLGFVSAMAQLHAMWPDVHFLLAGQGVDADNNVLVSAIHKAGVAGVCHLLGPRSDVPRLMAALDVLALPSVGEAFPNVVGEAMACAVPCAVTDVGDSAWIVGETGRVVPAGDMSGLAHAIHDLLKLPAEERAALGTAARERVASLFEIGSVVKQYEAFYESLVADGV
jgi:glycosyltransferase involved in cell wall biosynthesis